MGNTRNSTEVWSAFWNWLSRDANRPAASAMGNARPVQVRHGDDFEDVVNLVKDEVRRVRRGAAKMSGVSETASSRILRRIASDYRELPVSYRFHHVVWISPGRIGLFPGVSRSRGVLNSIVGEVVYALGRHRLTGTSDPMASIRSVRRIVGGSRWNDAEPILFVIDGFDDLIKQSQEDPKIFDELFSFLPTESVALYCRCSVDKAPSAEASRVDPIAESFVRGDTAQDEPRWAKPESQAEIASLLDDYDDPHFDNTSATVLAALCLVATPIAAVELALMLNLTQRDLAGTLRDLYERGLIEGAVDNTANIAGTESPHDPETEDGRSGSLGVLNPIRRAVLEDPDFRTELASVASTLLRWAETTVEGLSNWGEDNAQLDQLTRHLPNVLTVFEACCWLSALDANGLGSDAVDRHLWLGTDLGYILYNVGRWAEAEQLLEYLGERAKGRIPGTEIEDAPKPAELHTFLSRGADPAVSVQRTCWYLERGLRISSRQGRGGVQQRRMAGR